MSDHMKNDGFSAFDRFSGWDWSDWRQRADDLTIAVWKHLNNLGMSGILERAVTTIALLAFTWSWTSEMFTFSGRLMDSGSWATVALGLLTRILVVLVGVFGSLWVYRWIFIYDFNDIIDEADRLAIVREQDRN